MWKVMRSRTDQPLYKIEIYAVLPSVQERYKISQYLSVDRMWTYKSCSPVTLTIAVSLSVTTSIIRGFNWIGHRHSIPISYWQGRVSPGSFGAPQCTGTPTCRLYLCPLSSLDPGQKSWCKNTPSNINKFDRFMKKICRLTMAHIRPRYGHHTATIRLRFGHGTANNWLLISHSLLKNEPVLCISRLAIDRHFKSGH